MKKYIIISILVTLLVGCGQIDVTSIKKATQYCTDKGGVKEITHFIGSEVCDCVNGDVININLIKLNKENY